MFTLYIAEFIAPTVAAVKERPQLSLAATSASTMLWDPSKAPKDSELDALLVRTKLDKRGQQPRRAITHAYVLVTSVLQLQKVQVHSFM